MLMLQEARIHEQRLCGMSELPMVKALVRSGQTGAGKSGPSTGARPVLSSGQESGRLRKQVRLTTSSSSTQVRLSFDPCSAFVTPI